MSAPTHEHAPSSVEHYDQLSQADLLVRREALESEIARYDDELAIYVNQLKESEDPEYSILEQLDDDHYSEESEGDADESSYSYLIKHGEGLLSPYLIETLSKLSILVVAELDIETQLDSRFASGLSEYARNEAMELYLNLDYVAVGRHEKGKSPDLPDGDGIRLREFEETLPHPDQVVNTLHDIVYNKYRNRSYRYAEMQVDEIERCKDILERWGVGTKQSLPKLVYDHRELERAEELNNRYRNYHNQYSSLAAEFKPFLPMHEWAVNLSDTNVTKYYEHLAAIDLEKELERVQIRGLNLLPFDFSEDDMRDYIRTHIPAIALEGLDKLTFRNTAESEKNSKSHSELFSGKSIKVGHHSHNLASNNAEIVIFADQFRALYNSWLKSVSDKELVTDWTKDELLGTVAHEFGHALHHTLPVSILHEWDEVADSEKAEVTSYVAEMNKHDHAHRFIEDFADSFSLLVNRPYELHNKASQRYYKMHDLVTKLRPAA